MSHDFSNYLSLLGIHQTMGPPHAPKFKSFAEWTNRPIGNLVSCALLSAGLSKFFWVDGLWHIFFALNSYPCRNPSGFNSLNKILGIPRLAPRHLHPFGCLGWYKVPEVNQNKLDCKACSAMFLSYLSNGDSYCVWDLEQQKVIKTCDPVFKNCLFPFANLLFQSQSNSCGHHLFLRMSSPSPSPPLWI